MLFCLDKMWISVIISRHKKIYVDCHTHYTTSIMSYSNGKVERKTHIVFERIVVYSVKKIVTDRPTFQPTDNHSL